MEVSRIIAEIDAQILKLQQARALLAGTTRPQHAQAEAVPKAARILLPLRLQRHLANAS